MSRAAIVCAAIGCLFGGCGEVGSSLADLRADSDTLGLVLAEDPALGPLREVDDVVRERRPVRAAELIRTGAIPAIRRQRARIEALTTRTPEGLRVKQRAVTAHDARIESLEQYARALERGEVEDLQLAEAQHAQAVAELEIAEVMTAAEALKHEPGWAPAERRRRPRRAASPR